MIDERFAWVTSLLILNAFFVLMQRGSYIGSLVDLLLANSWNISMRESCKLQNGILNTQY